MKPILTPPSCLTMKAGRSGFEWAGGFFFFAASAFSAAVGSRKTFAERNWNFAPSYPSPSRHLSFG